MTAGSGRLTWIPPVRRLARPRSVNERVFYGVIGFVGLAVVWEAAAIYHEEVLGGSTRLESFTIDRNGGAARWRSAIGCGGWNWLGQPLQPQRIQHDDNA